MKLPDCGTLLLGKEKMRTILCKIWGHSWEFCKCKRCGKTRDEAHDWLKHICKICYGDRGRGVRECKECGKREFGGGFRSCKCSSKIVALEQLNVEQLKLKLVDPDREVRTGAVIFLETTGSDVVPLLKNAFYGADQSQKIKQLTFDLASHGYYGLVSKFGALAVEPLLTEIKKVREKRHYGSIWEETDRICKLIVELGAVAIPPLVEQLGGNDIYIKSAACDILGKMGASAVVPLVEALEDRNVRRDAAEALGNIGDRRAVEPLIDLLHDENDDGCRFGLVDSLGKIGDTRAVVPLIAILDNDNEKLRSWVAVALGRIGDTRAIMPLLAKLTDRAEEVRDSVVRALGKIGAPAFESLVGKLLDGLRNEDVYCIGAASRALRIIGDVRADALLVRAETLLIKIAKKAPNFGVLKELYAMGSSSVDYTGSPDGVTEGDYRLKDGA